MRRFLHAIKPSIALNIVTIDDPFGPTITEPDLDAIVVSTEVGERVVCSVCSVCSVCTVCSAASCRMCSMCSDYIGCSGCTREHGHVIR